MPEEAPVTRTCLVQFMPASVSRPRVAKPQNARARRPRAVATGRSGDASERAGAANSAVGRAQGLRCDSHWEAPELRWAPCTQLRRAQPGDGLSRSEEAVPPAHFSPSAEFGINR